MKLTTAIAMITKHDVNCEGCEDCEAAFVVLKANQTHPLVHAAVRNGFGHPDLQRMVPRTATKPRVAPRPTLVPPVVKTAAQWAAHFSALLHRTDYNEPPPPPNYNEAVRRHAAGQTTTPTTATRTTADGTPQPPDYNAAVRARHAQETHR